MSNEYQPEPGQWRLTSPSGAEHFGESPLHAVQAESRTRIHADVALNRIYAAIAPTVEGAAELHSHMMTVIKYADAMAGEQSTGLVPDGLVAQRFEDVRKSALKLMGLSDD